MHFDCKKSLIKLISYDVYCNLWLSINKAFLSIVILLIDRWVGGYVNLYLMEYAMMNVEMLKGIVIEFNLIMHN